MNNPNRFVVSENIQAPSDDPVVGKQIFCHNYTNIRLRKLTY